LVSVGRLERPLSALSTRSLCRLGYTDVVDQGGLEPPKLAQRIKSPPPLPLGSLVCLVNPGGLEPPAHGLKGRSPADPGWLRSGSDRANGCGGEPPRFQGPAHGVLRGVGPSGRYCPSCHSVISRGPRFSGSLGMLVRPAGAAPAASAMSKQRSADELRTQEFQPVSRTDAPGGPQGAFRSVCAIASCEWLPAPGSHRARGKSANAAGGHPISARARRPNRDSRPNSHARSLAGSIAWQRAAPRRSESAVPARAS
jgi:hypothetical protein